MTAKQRIHLMAELWPAAAAALGCSKDDRERRLEVLSQALGRPIASASDIDHLKEFDDVKAHLLSISHGANLGAQVKIANMPRTRLIYKCRELIPEENYIVAIARSRFHTSDWESLSESDLTQLRNTLAARAHARKRKPAPAAEHLVEAGDPDWTV